MSFNLADATKGLISPDLVTKASAFFDESETGINKALSGVIPVVLGGLIDKSSTNEGANIVAHLAAEQHSAGILDTLHNFFDGNSESFLTKGADLVNSIFDSKVSALSGVISNFSGVKTTSASSLLSMVTPVVLAFLGKNASTNNLKATGIANMLSSQKDNISASIPAGLSLGSIFGPVMPAAKPVAAVANHHEEEIVEGDGNGLKLLLPLLLLVLVAGGAWYFMGNHDDATTKTAITTEPAPTEKAAIATAAASHVDTSGNYIYDLGKMVAIDLPNGAGTLTVGENSTENKLYKFLADSTAKIDTVKGNWFEFTNVRFKTGGAQIDSISAIQLKNIVAISKGFFTAQFKLGGYTDNTGDTAANVALSQKRSDAVVVELKKLGASAKAIFGAKGYGPEFPIGDNATVEGKAMNRRVAINVKSK